MYHEVIIIFNLYASRIDGEINLHEFNTLKQDTVVI